MYNVLRHFSKPFLLYIICHIRTTASTIYIFRVLPTTVFTNIKTQIKNIKKQNHIDNDIEFEKIYLTL